VIILDEGPYLAALQHDIFEKLPVDKMPFMKDVPQKFIDPRGLGAFVSGQIIGIAYNTDKIKTPAEVLERPAQARVQGSRRVWRAWARR
jgi:putative spermidine/putrescine transport system substrate-binding protein